MGVAHVHVEDVSTRQSTSCPHLLPTNSTSLLTHHQLVTGHSHKPVLQSVVDQDEIVVAFQATLDLLYNNNNNGDTIQWILIFYLKPH